jgi:hypothetical protein
MFTREKYCKNNQSLNHSGISKNITSSNKYHQRTYQKTKKQIPKKNLCNRLWKKSSSSYIYWTDKENDKNNQNFNYNKKFHYDNKKKPFRYQKKISYSELDNDLNINEEEKNNFENENEEKIKFKKDEYDSKEEISKDEKNNSFEYTITTAYSNSISAHEESNNNNNNTLNLNENLNNSEFKLNSKELNPNENNNNYIGYNSEQNNFYGKSKSKEENKNENINLNKIQENDINNTFFSNSMKNLNFIRINSCPNPINDFSSISSTQIAKVQNINKFPENISSEPFNKYNSINQELNQLWINPIAENTEILNVNVKISKNKSAIFKLRRFDDLFLTVKLFCEIHLIDEKFMKPIIIKSLCALNNIYQVLNSPIDTNNIKRLKMMNSFFNNTYI